MTGEMATNPTAGVELVCSLVAWGLVASGVGMVRSSRRGLGAAVVGAGIVAVLASSLAFAQPGIALIAAGGTLGVIGMASRRLVAYPSIFVSLVAGLGGGLLIAYGV